MGIRQTTPNAEVDRMTKFMADKTIRVIVRNLSIAGEKAVNTARADNKGHRRGSYKDQTDNLRSSIGYVVVIDGKIVEGEDSFKVVGDGQEGADEGLALARSLAARFPKGAALILVAGMKYAIHVQRLGFDVTISAQHMADKLLASLGFPKTKTLQ